MTHSDEGADIHHAPDGAARPSPDAGPSTGQGPSQQTTVAFDVPEDDDAIRKGDVGLEDYLTLVVFWLLALDVFVQFFSRYVLGNSLAWTEEIARYLLVAVGFLGSAMAARKGSHIAVEFFYRYLSEPVARTMWTLVDLVRIAFLGMLAWITWQLAGRTNSMMVSIDLPKSLLYYVVFVGVVLMLVRSIQLAIRHWKTGESELMCREDD
ncbi:TRAP transporter small permease [Halomonas denitrificans]|uniref:TRAP transporter small permease n=1 Tax=Halomonas denitrificans TaxID=370769 RepID=UPI001C99232B|nr:TRAP transporter small permease [Halomonas denitrificans]MBY5968850.1 TRAP transporter small permease [Halomonas denitrificans]